MTKKANKVFLFLVVTCSSNYAASQFSLAIGLGRTYYSSNGLFSRFNFHDGIAYQQIYQNNQFMGSAALQYLRKKNIFTLDIERNSITFNKQRFDRNGQLTRSFWFSVFSIGVGRSWLLTPPEATKIKLNLNAYGFTIFNKSGVEKNSYFYFSPSTYQSHQDQSRESYSIRSSKNLGFGLNGMLMIYPKLKNPNISFFAEADVSITPFFKFTWQWQEDGHPIPVSYNLNSHRRTFTLGIAYLLSKNKKLK